MRTLAQKQNQPQQKSSTNFTKSNRSAPAVSHETHPILRLQRTIGNQAVQRFLKARADGLEAGAHTEVGPTTEGRSETPTTNRFAHDFSRIPVHGPAPITIQPKLVVNTPGDIYEQEADQRAEQVMRMREPQLQLTCACGGGCAKCQMDQPSQEHQRLQTRHVGPSYSGQTAAPPIVHEVLASPGQPLDPATRAFMEPRFGHDLSHVRIHTDRKAAESARAVSALAYTVGSDVVFGEGQVSPHTLAGQRLLAHELVHTLQQNMSAEPAGVVRRQTSLDIALRSPGVTAQVLGSEILDGFKLNSHTLTAEHKRRLLALAKRLKEVLLEHQLGTVEITGHTDATGGESLNDRLGQDRADAVAAFLRTAGVPAVALLTSSAGESALRISTEKAEPRNRRVEIRFFPQLPTPSVPTPEPGAAKPPKEPVSIPQPENLCSEHPEICDPITTKPGTMPSCSSANCSAAPASSFDKLLPDFQLFLTKSLDTDAAVWFMQLNQESQIALTQFFNRMCRYGLLCHISRIVKISAGEAPASFLGGEFEVAGKTASVYFTTPSWSTLRRALMTTNRFCEASGLGKLMHPKGPSLRETSGPDSLHISVEGNEIEAHIDNYSPVPEQPHDGQCPNAPTHAALTHILRELLPELVRKYLGLPGLDVSPAPAPPAAVPPGAVAPEPFLEVARIKLHGPVKKRQPRSHVTLLPNDIERSLAEEIPKRIRPDALVPPDTKRQAEAAALAAEMAGPGEEKALVAARDEARERLESLAEDAHYFAQDMARRMDEARRSGRPDFLLQFGPIYNDLTMDDRRYVLYQIRDIARIVRALLAERAAGVHKIWVAFGESVIWDIDF